MASWVNEGKDAQTKARHIPCGDFANALLPPACRRELPGQYKFDSENAAAHRHGMIDARHGRSPQKQSRTTSDRRPTIRAAAQTAPNRAGRSAPEPSAGRIACSRGLTRYVDELRCRMVRHGTGSATP
jgi:hypothetical protein